MKEVTRAEMPMVIIRGATDSCHVGWSNDEKLIGVVVVSDQARTEKLGLVDQDGNHSSVFSGFDSPDTATRFGLALREAIRRMKSQPEKGETT